MATRLAITVTVPDLRNGDPATITHAAPRASIPSSFYWSAVRTLPHNLQTTYADAVVRAQYSQLMNGVTDDANNAISRRNRTCAIVLGGIRIGAAAAFRITAGDLNTSECVNSGTVYTPAIAAVPATDQQPAVAAIAASIGAGTGTAAAGHTRATSMTALTAAEVEVLNSLIYLGMAVPAMQGVSLTMTGHHFLPTTKKDFEGMKKQVLQAGGRAVTEWVDALGDDFYDWAFHKACHPILPTLKRSWAKSRATGTRLIASGHGAAAVRIPALPSEAQAAKAGLAILRKASPVIRGMRHTITWTNVERLITAAEDAPEGAAERTAVVALVNWFTATSTQISFCAGVVQHLSESAGATRESTLRAFSIRRAMDANTADVSRGTTYCRAYLAQMRESALAGTFADPNIAA